MAEKDFFVGIYEPVDVRRNLLESSKEVISSLQRYESIENIRKQKLLCYDELKSIMNELDLLMSKLKARLPDTKLRKETGISNKRNTFSGPTSENAEMRKLEEEIRKIEMEFHKI